jgi:hypothetical protein
MVETSGRQYSKWRQAIIAKIKLLGFHEQDCLTNKYFGYAGWSTPAVLAIAYLSQSNIFST